MNLFQKFPPAAQSWMNATADLARCKAGVAAGKIGEDELKVAEERVKFLVQEGADKVCEDWIADTGLRVFEFIPTDGDKMVREIDVREGVESIVQEVEQQQLSVPPLQGGKDE